MRGEVKGAPRAAIWRRRRAVLSRRGMALSVAVNGHVHDGQITALVETMKLSSSAFARYVEKCWHQRREWYPDEHPITALHRARFYADAAMHVAKRRLGHWD